MAKRKTTTRVFLNGKRVRVTDCNKIKGFQKQHKMLKELAFMPGGSVEQSLTLSNGNKLKVIVKNNRKPIAW